MFQNIKIRKSFGALIKALVFIGVCYVLYNQLRKISYQDIAFLEIKHLGLIFVSIALVVFNWGIELVKWMIITKPFRGDNNSITLAKSMFAGISTGIITPNRIGNFLGRILYFSGKSRILAALGTLYTNLSQFIATLLFGTLGIYYLGAQLLDPNQLYLIQVALYVALCISLLIYFGFAFAPQLFSKFYRKHQNTTELLHAQLSKKSALLLLLSLLRYLVFVTQFGFLLLAFGVSYSEELIAALYLHFVITSLTPSLIFGKLVIRETVALLLLGVFVGNPAVIILASLSLWVINLGVPALIGLFFLSQKRIANVA